MKLLTQVEFRADFPDDMIEDEHDIIQFGGLGMASALRTMLTDQGYDVSEPLNCGVVGWELDIRSGGIRFWLRISQSDAHDYVVHAQDMTWKFWLKGPSFAEFLAAIDNWLHADGRFDQVGWFRDWRDDTRAAHPVQSGPDAHI